MPTPDTSPDPFAAFTSWLGGDPATEEAKRRLWAMTPDERVRAMRAGELSLWLCLHWASRAPEEVPMLDGEWEFIAVNTPEVADIDDLVSCQNHPPGRSSAARDGVSRGWDSPPPR